MGILLPYEKQASPVTDGPAPFIGLSFLSPPCSKEEGAHTAHAGSKCRNWYLAMTQDVLPISWERIAVFLCPASGNDNRLTSSWFSFPATHQAQAMLRNKNLDLVLFCCSVLPPTPPSWYIDCIIRSRPWQGNQDYGTFPPSNEVDWTSTAQTCRGFLLRVQPLPLLRWTW